MDGGIYLELDGELVSMTEQEYSEERVLQDRLADYPRLLAGEQMGSDTRKWLLIAQEAGIPDNEKSGDRWSADHLFIDQDGIPTIVEVKRAVDTRSRREVVGQAFDYISHACIYIDAEDLEASFVETWEERGEDPDDKLVEFIGDESPEQFWQQAQANLRAKRVRVLFVADRIRSELKRIVEFMNEGFSDVEVYAIEVAQFKGDGAKAYVPRLYGQTEEARSGKKTSRYDGAIKGESAFFADIDEKVQSGEITAELGEAYIELYEFAQELGDTKINPAQNASFNLVVEEHQGDANGNPGVFSANINGKLKIWNAGSPLPDSEDEPSRVAWEREDFERYQAAFAALEGNNDKNRAPIEVLTEGNNLEEFKKMVETFVDRCKTAAREDG